MTPSEIQAYSLLARECGVDFDAGGCQDNETDLDEEILSEAQVMRTMIPRPGPGGSRLSFLSAGACDYFSPAIVNHSAIDSASPVKNTRSIESFLARITGLPQCSLSADDVVTTLAGLLCSTVANNSTHKPVANKKVLLSAGIAPRIRSALHTQLRFHAIDTEVVDFDIRSGCMSAELLDGYRQCGVSACVFAWPNFFGALEPLQRLSEWARKEDVQLIGIVNPGLLGYLKSPAEISDCGIDYLVGDCQPFGLPVYRAGNAPSFVASREGAQLFSVTAMTGSAHHRDLAVINSYVEARGLEGMRESVAVGHQRLLQLVEELQEVAAISIAFSGSAINETVIRLNGVDLARALNILAGHNMLCGYRLDEEYPQLQDALLIHCNDQHEAADVEKLATKLKTVVKNLGAAACPVKPKF